MQQALDNAVQDVAAKIAEHAYNEHVVDGREFPEVGSQVEFRLLIQNVIQNNEPLVAPDGGVFFYEQSTNTLVIINPAGAEDASAFRPSRGIEYLEDQLTRRR